MALVVDTRAVEKRSQVMSMVQPRELFERNYNTLSVPPPHPASFLKNHIIKSEDVSGHAAQLFKKEGSESAMNDSDALTLLSDTFPSSLLQSHPRNIDPSFTEIVHITTDQLSVTA